MLAGVLFALPAVGVDRALTPLSGVADVALGLNHSCVLSTRGTVSCWGDNGDGQLGVGVPSTQTARTTPIPVANLGSGLRAIATGHFHSCAITSERGVRCWGWNAYGQLGDGTFAGGSAPVAVKALDAPVLAISLGAVHSCALLQGGRVKCWGANESGQLGDGAPVEGRALPVEVLDLAGVAAIDAGSGHTCAMLGDGSMKCWGRNDGGALGDGSRTDRARAVAVQGLGGPVRSIASGANHTCAVLAQGALHCWGDEYPLGAFEGGSTVARPYPGFESGYTQVDAGNVHACALRVDGAIKCLGDNLYGVFGNGPIDGSRGSDFTVGLEPGIVQVAAGGDHTCARNAAGGLQCWGRNTRGQLGLGSTTKRLTPTPVAGLDRGVVAVASGGGHGCALTDTGAVKCWGSNSQSQVGDDTDRLRLTQVDVLDLGNGVRALAVGGDHSCAITRERRVLCWGANHDGRLGDGGDLNRGRPTPVLGLGESDMAAIAVGAQHACALSIEGAVYCWGINTDGQLGDGSNESRRRAVPVSGLDRGVRAITAGYDHACAITTAGALKCWGSNSHGQLGDASITDRNTPVDVVGLVAGVSAVGAGAAHTCAVLGGGEVKCWGYSFFGRVLGDGSEQDRSVPGDVPALRSGVVEIALGLTSTCVRTAAGAMKCWGSGDNIGNNSEANSAFPVDVSGLSRGVTQIDIGIGGSTCAVVAGGARCWGENTLAQLGDGTTYGVPEPQPVLVDERQRRGGAVVPDANDASRAARFDASGRFVVFQSRASNLVQGDSNGNVDVFRTDRESGETERISVDDAGGQIGGDSIEPSISADGTLVLFVAPDAGVAKVAHESATQREARRKGTGFGVFLRNLVTGTTQRMGAASGSGTGTAPQIAPGGTAVVFSSDTAASGGKDVFHLTLTRSGDAVMPGALRCVSCKSVAADGSDTGNDAQGEGSNAVVSADGMHVAWQSTAKNALASQPSPCPGTSAEILLRDMVSGVLQRMSPPPATVGTSCGTVGSTLPSIDYAGDTLAFQSDQALSGGDGNGVADVYVIDLPTAAAPQRLSEGIDGSESTSASSAPAISGDGETVVFVSAATDLDLSFSDNNGRADVHSGRVDGDGGIARLSRGSSGAEADAASDQPSLNYDGTKVTFVSAAISLIGAGANSTARIFQLSNPQVAPPKSATWWNASESGWGLTVFDQGNVLAPTWFTYDSDGEPTWFIVGGAFEQPDGRFTGELLRFTGTRYDQINGAAAQSVTPIGSIALSYGGERKLGFEYTALGSTRTRQLESFPFGNRGFSCSASPQASRDSASNYTDLWTGAEAPNAGWGLTLFHIDDGIFAIWYTYDLDGEATFFVITTQRQADDSFRGEIFKQRNGTPFLQIDGQPASPSSDVVGNATLRFSDGDSASFRYVIGGVDQTKPIARLLVGSRATVCSAESLSVVP
jgi:alpha-tubulin suppressor-like RCC1 family protein/Tol biopolymer transport system component